MGAMVIDMNVTGLCALGQIQAFLEGTEEVRFQSVGDDEGRRQSGSAEPRSRTSKELKASL